MNIIFNKEDRESIGLDHESPGAAVEQLVLDAIIHEFNDSGWIRIM